MTGPGITYQPALDGLRAFAVTAVILYHLSYSWAGGGYLGVDAFFVLSGFLITTLLLTEHAGTGRVSLGGFWGRRARRLLPALFLLLVVVVLYASTTMTALQLDDLRGDAIASLFYVANWHFIATDQSYFALLTVPSPLQHLWSLAIEEQFYLLWPLVVVGVLAVARASRRVLVIVTVAGIVLSQMAMAWLYEEADPSRAYYGTEARAHTILVGCLLALILSRRPVARGATKRVLGAAGLAAFAVCIVVWWRAEPGPRLFYGGDLVFSVVVAVVIAAAVQPTGALRTFLGLRAFRFVGFISYGLYLWHWPVIVFATPERTDLTGVRLDLFRIGITVGAALISYYLLEQPIRRGVLRPRLARIALPLSIVVVLVIVLAGTATSVSKRVPPIARVNHEPGACGDAQSGELAEAAAKVGDLGPFDDDRGRGLRIVVVGDSIACALLTGLEAVGATQQATVANATILGCGVISGTVASGMLPRAFTTACPRRARTRQQRAIARTSPDAIVWWSDWETADLDVDGRSVAVGTPEGDAVLRSRMELAFDRMHRRGAPIVILTVPPLLPWPALPVRVASAEAKHHRLNDLFREFAAAHPGDVVVVDLAHKICPSDPCPERIDGVEPRPYDGLHLTPKAAAWAAHWLWPQLAAAAHPSR
jgi:peptidoglycan/LPS O-acetylase OafA/YrhL